MSKITIYTIDNIIFRKNNVTKLQLQRKKYGYSQRELAEKTGVSIRTLQHYELGTKGIKKHLLVQLLHWQMP